MAMPAAGMGTAGARGGKGGEGDEGGGDGGGGNGGGDGGGGEGGGDDTVAWELIKLMVAVSAAPDDGGSCWPPSLTMVAALKCDAAEIVIELVMMLSFVP